MCVSAMSLDALTNSHPIEVGLLFVVVVVVVVYVCLVCIMCVKWMEVARMSCCAVTVHMYIRSSSEL